MADIANTKYYSLRKAPGSRSAMPPDLEEEPPIVNPNPSGLAVDHNSTLNKDGGDPELDEFYHLSAADYQKVLDLENPAPQDDVGTTGTVVFNTPTSVTLTLWAWIISGITHTQPTQTISPITGTPTTYNRVDIAVGKNDSTIQWIAGSENPDILLDPVIPAGTILLSRVVRTPAGVNTIELINAALTNFVSKSDLDNQTIKSPLRLEALSGVLQNSLGTDLNGQLRLVPAARAGVYTTLGGDGGLAGNGWSKMLSITIDPTLQQNYVVTFQMLGVSPTYEKGEMWCLFKVDNVTGDIVTNSLKLFGEFDVNNYKLLKVDSTHYELYLKHGETDSLYSYRPIMLFGNDFRYEFFEGQTIVTLPVVAPADSYNFSLVSGGGGVQSVTGSNIDNTDPLNPIIVSDDPIASTGSVIYFDKPRTYNDPTTPNTNTTLTEDNTALRKITQVIFHQATSFNPPATWELSTGSDTYDSAKINVIYVEAFSSTYKRYIIDHDV